MATNSRTSCASFDDLKYLRAALEKDGLCRARLSTGCTLSHPPDPDECSITSLPALRCMDMTGIWRGSDGDMMSRIG